MAMLFGVLMYRLLWRNSFDQLYFTCEERYQPVDNRHGYNVTKTIANKCCLENFPTCNTNRLLCSLVPIPVA